MILVSSGYSQDNNRNYTKFILENNSETSSKALNQKFRKFKKNLNSSQLNDSEIIYKVLLANLVSNQQTQVSEKCINLYSQALDLVKKTDNVGLQIWVESQLGFYYYKFYKYDKASNYFINTSRLLETNSDEALVDPVSVLKYNAYFFTSINEKELSNVYLKRALKFTTEKDCNFAAFLNAIGENYYNLGKNELAEDYFKKTIVFSKQNNDSLRLAKGMGDLAQIYILNKNFQEAEELLLDDIQISKDVHNLKNTIFAQIRLAQMYLDQKKYVAAKEMFHEALENLAIHKNLQKWELDINKALVLVALHDNDFANELLFRRKIDSLRPIVDTIDGAEVLKKISWKNENEVANWKFKTEQINLEKETLMKTTFFIISLLLLCLLMLFIIIFKRRFKLQKIVFENNLLTAQLEKINMEQELIEANNSLQSFKDFLSEKNNEIVKLETVLKELETSSLNNISDEKLKLENLISSHLMTEENWQAFRKTFIKEDPEFYKEIQTKFPDLSDSNLRLILLQRLGLSNQQTANLLGVTIHAIKKAKQRLRKKYGESISNFV